MARLSFITLCLAAYCSSLTSAAELVLTLPNGQIRGREITTATNKVFYGFQGIPYAEPPVGDLRFKAPQPLTEPWDGILDATQDKDDCLNKAGNEQNAQPKSENCLFINVYTPNLVSSNSSSSELLPVMFWIFGGGFTSGTSTYSMYGPDYLIEEGVVFVSFNYRLGPFGFLSTGDEVIPGNAGLKDQNLALKWTHDNIHLFGGDPDKITIFGESAGSASVSYHLASEKSAGLFRAAIGESGTSIGYWSRQEDAHQYSTELVQNLATNLKLTLDDTILENSTALLEFLMAQSAEDIMTADSTTTVTAVPVIEVPHEGAFISQSTYELFRHGNVNKVPLVLGFNSEEYLILMGGVLQNAVYLAQSIDQNIETLIPTDLILDESANRTEIGQLIKSIYLREDQRFADNVGAAIQYGSDNFMTRPIIKHAQLFNRYADVYFYQFSYHGLLGMMQNISVDGLMGTVGHAEEMPYLFKMIHLSGVNTTDLSKFSEQDQLVQKRTVKLWTNFAKSLNPTPDDQDTELFQNVKWPILKHRGFQYLDIGENLELVKGYPRADHFHKWQSIYSNYGQRPFITY